MSPFVTDDVLFMQFVLQAGFSSSRCSWPQGYYLPWFSLYAFVSFSLTTYSSDHPRRSSCSPTWSAITLTP